MLTLHALRSEPGNPYHVAMGLLNEILGALEETRRGNRFEIAQRSRTCAELVAGVSGNDSQSDCP